MAESNGRGCLGTRLMLLSQLLCVFLISWYCIRRTLDEWELRRYRWLYVEAIAASQETDSLRRRAVNRTFRQCSLFGDYHLGWTAGAAERSPTYSSSSESSSQSQALEMSVNVVVKSSPHDFERRQLVRQSWLNRCKKQEFFSSTSEASKKQARNFQKIRLSCLFLTGESSDKAVAMRLTDEVTQHGDIFVTPFLDDGGASTPKTFWTLAWYQHHVPTADYVMVCNDDVYLVLQSMLLWLSSQPRYGLYAGELQHPSNQRVQYCKVNAGKNCINGSVALEEGSYPSYTLGYAYVMSHDVTVQLVYQALLHSSNIMPGNAEDVIVGYMAGKAGVGAASVDGVWQWSDSVIGCKRKRQTVVVGGLNAITMKTMARNEQLGRPLCFGLDLELRWKPKGPPSPRDGSSQL